MSKSLKKQISQSVLIQQDWRNSSSEDYLTMLSMVKHKRSLQALPPLNFTKKEKDWNGNYEKTLIDKGVSCCFPMNQYAFRRNEYRPTRIILAVPIHTKTMKSSFTKITTKSPADNKAYKMMQSLANKELSPITNFKALLNGSKIKLSSPSKINA